MYADIICVTNGDLATNCSLCSRLIRLCRLDRSILRISRQYSITFFSRQEGASDVLSGVNVNYVDADVLVEFGDLRSNRS